MPGSMDATYRCVRCHSPLVAQEGAGLSCPVCTADYPTVGGIKVLTLKPHRLIQAHVGRVPERRKELADQREKLSARGEGDSPQGWARALQGYDGLLANLEVVEQALQPAREYLASHPARKGLLDDFLLESAWPSFHMLGYFYRDWGGTDEARFVTDLFTGAVQRHGGGERDRVAVLGCGACRLVHDLGELFPTVYGVDLAFDSLLLARALLEGGELNLTFNFPRPQLPIAQKVVRVQGPAQSQAGIELVTADVARLPFSSSSLRYVLSQYLLDIVPSPNKMISEIRRVLAPGGLWINFSNLSDDNSPPEVRSYDQVNNLDLPSFLRKSGFALREESMHRFTLLDLSSVSEWALTNTESPIFFVAQKDTLAPEPRDLFAEYFARQGDGVWSLAPRLASPVSMIQERIFTASGIQEGKRIRFSGGMRPLSNDMALLAEGLLRMIDGTRTLGEMFGGLKENYGNLIGEDDFLGLFSELSDIELIALTAPSEPPRPR